jgi:hypothetical protein
MSDEAGVAPHLFRGFALQLDCELKGLGDHSSNHWDVFEFQGLFECSQFIYQQYGSHRGPYLTQSRIGHEVLLRCDEPHSTGAD